MILQYKTFEINTTSLPATWTLTSNQACATAEQLTGTTTDGNIFLGLQFQNESCFNVAQYTLTVIDSCGRVEAIKINPINNCSGWSLSLTDDNQFNFQAVVIGGNGSQTYQWIYNTSVFELSPTDDSENGYLSLQLKSGEPIPNSETLTLIVQDSNGCVQQLQHTFSVCQAQGSTINLAMSCATFADPIPGTTGIIDRATRVSGFRYTPCAGRTIDWSTLQFSNVPANIFPIQINNDRFIVYANTLYNNSVSPVIKARVKDNLGVWSEYVNIGLTVPTCTKGIVPITINSEYVFAPGEGVVGAIAYKALEDHVATDETLDWSTFTFVPGSGQTLVTATSLTTANASVILGVDRRLKYTVASVPTDTRADTVKWRISTESGLKSKEGRVYFDYSVATAPVAVADAICVVCGGTTTIQPLANDTGVINPTSFTVTAIPTKGNYTFNNPDLTFTANTQTSGTDTLTYKVANPDGNFSNTTNVTYTIYCAGEDNRASKCTGATVNFTSFLSSWASSGGTWTQSGSNPDTVSLGSPSSVSFSGKPAGTYVFTYTVTSGGCTDAMTLTIYLKTASTNDNCTTATVVAWPASAPGSSTTVAGEILECDTDYTLETVAGVDQNPGSWNTSHSGDIWYSFTTSAVVLGSVTINGSTYGSQGIRNPQVALYSGGCTIDTFTIVANASETNGGQSLTLNFPTLSATTAYKIRVTSGEYQGSATGGIGKFNLTLTGLTP